MICQLWCRTTIHPVHSNFVDNTERSEIETLHIKQLLPIALACAIIIGVISFPANAAEVITPPSDITATSYQLPRATSSFDTNISAQSKLQADPSLPLSAGDTVTISATYTPASASVDFGLLTPNGTFYYLTASDGSIDSSIEIPENGHYVFQIRNNSKVGIHVMGFVHY